MKHEQVVEKEEIWDSARLTKTCSSNRRRINMIENNVYGILLMICIFGLLGIVGTVLLNHNQINAQNKIINEYAQSVYQMRIEIDELTKEIAVVSANSDDVVAKVNESEQYMNYAYEEMERVWVELNLLKSIFDQVEIAE